MTRARSPNVQSELQLGYVLCLVNLSSVLLPSLQEKSNGNFLSAEVSRHLVTINTSRILESLRTVTSFSMVVKIKRYIKR